MELLSNPLVKLIYPLSLPGFFFLLLFPLVIFIKMTLKRKLKSNVEKYTFLAIMCTIGFYVPGILLAHFSWIKKFGPLAVIGSSFIAIPSLLLQIIFWVILFRKKRKTLLLFSGASIVYFVILSILLSRIVPLLQLAFLSFANANYMIYAVIYDLIALATIPLLAVTLYPVVSSIVAYIRWKRKP